MSEDFFLSNCSHPRFSEIFTPEALLFAVELHKEFNRKRLELLQYRKIIQEQIDNGYLPQLLNDVPGDWKIKPIPKNIEDRRVEITGPPDKKMLINAFNSGASCYMSDFEDSLSPTLQNITDGHANIKDAVNKNIELTTNDGKHYKLNEKIAKLFVRVRGLHLNENHLLIDGEPAFAGLFDFAIHFYHNAKKLIEEDSGIYFYLPKMQNHLEVRLWNSIFEMAQDKMNIPRGTIKATLLIEHILASFELDQILFEIKDHSAGLNCGRWDYIFSFIKTFKNRKEFLLPDRSQITMTVPFMRAYCLNVIKTCHKRGAHAIGGMAAQIPIKNDEEANNNAFAKIKQDKEREVTDGHDGTWVAHPGIISIAKQVFDKHMPTSNQINKLRDDVNITERDLVEIPTGNITDEGLRTNIGVGIRYIESWLRGIGCVPINNLMEDAATAEICRTQLWQWINYEGRLSNGNRITGSMYNKITNSELNSIRSETGLYKGKGKLSEAANLFNKLILSNKLEDFLTTSSYKVLCDLEAN